MLIYLWVLELFFLLLFIHCINAIINPAKILNWTIDRYKQQLKFYCFECEIKASPKSITVIRYGHIIVAIMLIIYMVLFFRYWPIH